VNLLEQYIVEIHSEEPCVEDWMSQFPGKEFVKIDMTTNCYGSKKRSTYVWNTTMWAKIKAQGYYMG
jgi:hypothetical protein